MKNGKNKKAGKADPVKDYDLSDRDFQRTEEDLDAVSASERSVGKKEIGYP